MCISVAFLIEVILARAEIQWFEIITNTSGIIILNAIKRIACKYAVKNK